MLKAKIGYQTGAHSAVGIEPTLASFRGAVQAWQGAVAAARRGDDAQAIYLTVDGSRANLAAIGAYETVGGDWSHDDTRGTEPYVRFFATPEAGA